MKRIIFILSFMSATLCSFAQFHISPVVGLNISDVTGDWNSTSKIGYRFGVDARYYFKNNWGISSGLYFSEKGSHNLEGWIENPSTPNVNQDLVRMNLSMNYLQLPVLASYKVEIKPHVLLSINCGPYVSYGVNGTGNIIRADRSYGIGYNPFDKNSYVLDYEDDIVQTLPSLSRWDCGLSVGMDLRVYNVLLSMGYERGFRKLSSYFPVRSDVENKHYNTAYMLNLAYVFSL